MFERFTEAARQVVVLAQEEARTLGHHRVGAEHLLLGVVRVEPAILAAGPGDIRARIGRGVGATPPQIPMTAGARAHSSARLATPTGWSRPRTSCLR